MTRRSRRRSRRRSCELVQRMDFPYRAPRGTPLAVHTRAVAVVVEQLPRESHRVLRGRFEIDLRPGAWSKVRNHFRGHALAFARMLVGTERHQHDVDVVFGEAEPIAVHGFAAVLARLCRAAVGYVSTTHHGDELHDRAFAHFAPVNHDVPDDRQLTSARVEIQLRRIGDEVAERGDPDEAEMAFLGELTSFIGPLFMSIQIGGMTGHLAVIVAGREDVVGRRDARKRQRATGRQVKLDRLGMRGEHTNRGHQ